MLHASLERVMKTREEIRTSLFSAVCDLMAFSISFPPSLYRQSTFEK